jgi:hypothetical protein
MAAKRQEVLTSSCENQDIDILFIQAVVRKELLPTFPGRVKKQLIVGHGTGGQWH